MNTRINIVYSLCPSGFRLSFNLLASANRWPLFSDSFIFSRHQLVLPFGIAHLRPYLLSLLGMCRKKYTCRLLHSLFCFGFSFFCHRSHVVFLFLSHFCRFFCLSPSISLPSFLRYILDFHCFDTTISMSFFPVTYICHCYC